MMLVSLAPLLYLAAHIAVNKGTTILMWSLHDIDMATAWCGTCLFSVDMASGGHFESKETTSRSGDRDGVLTLLQTI